MFIHYQGLTLKRKKAMQLLNDGLKLNVWLGLTDLFTNIVSNSVKRYIFYYSWAHV